MPENNSAVFNEVLEVKVDVEKFRQGLAEIKAAYDKWVSEIGQGSEGLVGAGIFSGIKQELSQFRDDFTTVNTENLQTFNNLATSILQLVDKIDAAQAQAAHKQRERAKATAEAEINAAKEVAKAKGDSSADTGSSVSEDRALKQHREILTEQKGLIDQRLDAEDKIAEKRRKLSQEIEIEQQGIRDREFEGIEKQFRRKAELSDEIAIEQQGLLDRQAEREEARLKSQKKLAEEIAVEQQGIADKQLDAQEKLAARQKKLAQDITIEQQGIVDQSVAKRATLEEKAALSKRSVLNEELAAAESLFQREQQTATFEEKEAQKKRRVLNEELNTAHRIAQEFERAAAALDRVNSKRVRPGEEVEHAHAVALENQEKQIKRNEAANQSFFQKFFGGMERSIVHLTRFFFLWQAIQAISQALEFVLTAPFAALADGVKHLTEIQTAASELVGVLAGSVEFSKDLAENFQQARTASEGLVHLLQDISAATAIPFEQLKNVSKALVEAGAVDLAGNLENTARFAEIFNLAVKASGAGALEVQSTLGQINILLNGNVEKNNKFLFGLGITADTWVKIREEARKHGDLLDRLPPKALELVSAVREAEKFNVANLLEKLNLLRIRIESLVAKPIFDEIADGLRRVYQWVSDNKDILVDYGQQFVAVFRTVADLLKRTAEVSADLKIDLILKAANVSALALVNSLGTVVNTLLAIIEITGKIGDDEGAKKVFDQYLDRQKQLIAQIQDLLDTSAGLSPPAPERGDDDPLKRRLNGKNTPGVAESQLGSIRKQFEIERKEFDAAVEAIKDRYNDLKQATQEALSARKLSHQQAAQDIIKANGNEIAEIDRLHQTLLTKALATKARLSGDPGSNPDQRKDAVLQFGADLKGIDNALRKFYNQLGKEDSSARRRANNEVFAIDQEHFKSLLELRRLNLRSEQALVDSFKQQGLLTEVQAHDRRTELLEAEKKVELDILDEQSRQLNSGTQEYAQVLARRSQVDKQYTDRLKLQADIRRELVRREEIERQEHFNRLAAIDQEAKRLTVEIANLLLPTEGFNVALEALLTSSLRELDNLEAQKLAHLEVAKARNAESAETRQLTEDLKALGVERLRRFGEKLQAIDSTTPNEVFRQVARQKAVQDELAALEDRRRKAEQALADFDARNSAQVSSGIRFPGADGSPGVLQKDGSEDFSRELADERQRLSDELQQASASVGDFTTAIERSQPTVSQVFRSLLNRLVGGEFLTAWNNANGAVAKFGVITGAAAQGLANLGGIIDNIKAGFAKGGVLGAVGAGIGQFGDLLSKIPVIGQFIPAISGVLSFVGGLFTAAAKRIAEDVKKNFQQTLEQFRNGNTTLVDTINELERQRLEAISRLSGKKGGKDELDKLLPEFDSEISNLRKQQAQILSDFDNQLDLLRLQSDTLAQVTRQWQDINKQVREYIGAGGDAAKAAEFLSLNLQNIQRQAAEELSRAEQDAIQDAIRLNDLLKERQRIVDDFAKREFDLINADALERRQPGSVQRGQELQRLRQEHQEKLTALDDQIRLQTIINDKQSEVFNLSTDLFELRRRDEALTLQALDLQIQKWLDLKSIVNSISLGQNGLFTGAPGGVFGGGNTFDIDVTIVQQPGDTGADLASGFLDSVQSELDRRSRLVPA